MIAQRCLLLVLASVVVAGTAMAESINVPNYSFESPDIGADPGYTYTIDNWTKGGVSSLSGILENGYLGYTVTNLDGGQAGFVAAVSGTSTGYVYQVLSATYTVRNLYTLTVGVAKSGAAPFGGAESKLD
ncbi:MAG: hypothetical protein KJ985_15505, partial [Proteobacteria bacterium]|nr:hypothetical protein [Pseudomonadota bacterium]